MAHILIAYKQFPAPSVGHAGGESLFRLMAALRQRGHRLTLVARIADDELSHLPALRDLCERVYTVPHHRSLPGPRLLAFLRSYLALRKAIRRALRFEQPDFVHVETTQTAVAALGLKRPPASYRTQDVNWHLAEQSAARLSGARRLAQRLKRAVFRHLEPWVCDQYDLMLAISEGDRQLLAPVCSRPPVLLPLTPAVQPDSDAPPAVIGEANLVFVGAMGRDHNLNGITWFLDRTWPRIAEACPATRLYVVGGGPPDWLRARADGERVFVTGFVEDVGPWYRAATIFISPLLVAGGLLQKVVDAMAMGVPIVATSVCNHGICAIPGTHLITADDPEAFAAAVLDLLQDPERRRQLATAAQAFVQSHYDLEAAVDRWEASILDLLSQSTHTTGG